MTSTSSKLYVVRDAKPGDLPFILSTWLKGLRFGCSLFGEIPPKIYFDQYQKIISGLLQHPSIETKVACLPDDEDVILGYSVQSKDGTKISWVFVKSAWRGMGIAKALVPPTVVSASHYTKTGLSLLRKRGMVFDPFNIV